MWTGGVPVALLLLISSSLIIQITGAEDLYWEGEEDASNEFLEVKEEDLAGRIKRHVAGAFDFLSFLTPTTTTEEPESEISTVDPDVEEATDAEEEVEHGSGVVDRTEPEPGEKTLRVNFVVMEPYQTEFSNRDSEEFRYFSRSLAEAVDQLYENLPGTQRASLVRIQSSLSDEFSCNVTLDIVTTGFDNMDNIASILKNHIRERRKLGSVAVNDSEFGAYVNSPGFVTCDIDEIRCGDDTCVPSTARCNRIRDCFDGIDERDCTYPDETTTQNSETEDYDFEITTQAATTVDVDVLDISSTTPTIREACPPGYISCKEMRCVLASSRCDGKRDCDDGSDEDGCAPKSCGVDDFKCGNGKCIEGTRRCDRVVDCPNEEDENDCDCRPDEFQCVSDRSCIESRKRCDGVNHCKDSSDERDCACSTGQWQCDFGNCIKRSKRCDGRVDCPTDRSDERNCHATGNFRCRTGKLIPDYLRCNHRYDCPLGDYSDEQNCPCGDDDFKCDNGNCIPASKHCDRTHDCQDGSDERDCIYGSVCMAFQYKCSSGQCVPAESLCNGTYECNDSSDERNCPCKRDEFRCRDGTCLNFALRCNGYEDCRPAGEDELNCETQPRCPADSFTCNPDSTIVCASRCDGNKECSNGEDEDDCDVCSHPCDGRCLDESKICDGIPDCRDGSDEYDCDNCDGPEDFRCKSGECINVILHCNGVPECADESDEASCNSTVITSIDRCNNDEFQCRDGSCINNSFKCDGQKDCYDNSDEDSCAWYMTRPLRSSSPRAPCHESEFTCYDGNCITHLRRCDNIYDCMDFSDEQNCYNSGCLDDEFQCVTGSCIPLSLYCDGKNDCPDLSDETRCKNGWPTTTSRIEFRPEPTTTTTTTRRPFTVNNVNVYPDRCQRNEWRCENGPCIESYRRCDGHIDCPFDSSDEFDCPAGSPVALNLKTYPSQQTVRNRGDVVFQCRDEGPIRAPVRWVREGGRPLKPGSSDVNGRLEMNQVTTADSGNYICQAMGYLGSPGAEMSVYLNVEPAPVTAKPANFMCGPNEATCGNGQCIPKSAVCNGVVDCSDRSDEDTCYMNGKCDPNQFKCKNNKCVLLTWMCDSEDDCGDGSDEADCGYSAPGQCKTVEFTCASLDQCIPKSFHCDGQSDCLDGSDEIGCAQVYVTSPPKPSNVRLNVGDTLILKCSATGTPKPVISWRRNWGEVPEVCKIEQFDDDGQVTGVLTCPNMVPEYNGAYSCEAMNNKGTIFAVPDSYVFVNYTTVCPSGYFNSEARSERECIRCFCFGESSRCHSADLFTYNMPTPLGQGGTRLVGVKDAANGDAQLDSQSISDQYYYVPLRNGATVTKLARYTSNWGRSNALPYVTLPETYNGNQLTSYGGHIRYKLTPHFSSFVPDYNIPDIIIKGKYQNLVHYNRGSQGLVKARLTPENWQKPSSGGLVPATREDIMMALDNVELILLRASVNNAGVNITDFVMESAQLINVGLGAASLVEECVCPAGYEGLSCQKCASGYVRERSGQWLGHCVPERLPCPAGTYGDPNSGYACRPCPCPLTNRENQFAGACHLGSDGNVECDCYTGYEGRNCEYCSSGYIGNPLVVGDSCRPKPVDRCNPVGTSRVRIPDDCECKDNVRGRYCDQCKNDSFYLSSDFSQGCALCFCSGVTQQCMSTNLRRHTMFMRFNTPAITKQIGVYDTVQYGGRYNAPARTNISVILDRGEITLSAFDRSKPAIYYWSLPPNFAGDKVTSYGGHLTYNLSNVPVADGYNTRNNAADVQLISVNQLTFHYIADFRPSSDGIINADIQFLEKGWQRPDGKDVSREHFLLALADVEAILIKATYTSNSQIASLVSASIETAERDGEGPQALHVEQCDCPRGYIGTSCEDCAPGYTRDGTGLYLEHCAPCSCNGHSTMCDPETGDCTDCQDNTYGASCELCKPGYRRDGNDNCVADYNPRPEPLCDPRGSEEAYPSNGYCKCKQNVEGRLCDSCRNGTFGIDGNYALGCYSCYCSGVTSDCHEISSQFVRIPMAAPMLGSDYGGFRLMDLTGERVLSDNIIPEPLDSELTYVFNFPPNEELYWSLPVFPGNRVQSYGGFLQLAQKFESREEYVSEPGTDVILVGDELSLYWTNPRRINVSEPLSYKVPLSERGWFVLNLGTPVTRRDFMSVLSSLRRVLVRATLVPNLESTSISDVSMDTVTEQYSPTSGRAIGVEICICPEGYSGTSCESCSPGYYRDQYRMCLRCNCNGFDCNLGPEGVPVCNCMPPYTGSDCSRIAGDSSRLPSTSTLPPPKQPTVVVRITPSMIRIQTLGSTVNFTCKVQSRISRANLPVVWYKENGNLPQNRHFIDESIGMLTITNVQVSDSGKYICQTSDGVFTAQDYGQLVVPVNDMTQPTVEIYPAVNDYFEGERVLLECRARGNPFPTISWQRASGRPLPVSVEVAENYLIIESAREEDSGEYRCIATNTFGPVDRTAVVNIRRRPAEPTPDRLTVSQASPTVGEGQSIHVTCTGTTNVPAGTIDWVRQDGTQLLSNVRSENGVLYIDYATLENQGVYICQTSSYNVEPVLVVLNVIPQSTPPTSEQSNITVSVDSLKIPTGGSGTVDCVPTGYPLPLIKWTKYDGQFGPGTSQRQETLVISNAREDDQGYYLCQGIVNGRPEVSKYVLIEIEMREQPRIEIWPQGEQAVTLGSPFELRCTVQAGVPEPVVTWSRTDGRPLSSFTQLQSNNVLKFERIEVNDEGEYGCTASNIAGTRTAKTIIKVRSPPEVTITPGEYIQKLVGDSATVECRASGYPLPMVSISSTTRGEVVSPTPGMAVLQISSLREQDDGEYTCTAISVAGTIAENFLIRVDSNPRGDGGTFNNDVEGSGDYDVSFPTNPQLQPSDLYAAEDETTNVRCDVTGERDVRWSRGDGMPLQSNAQQINSELVIKQITKADSGDYICNVYNRYTGEVERSQYIRIIVVSPPRITLQPPQQTVQPGESPTVECIVEGDDIQEVTWRPLTKAFSRRVQIRDNTLIFNRIEVGDAGLYECVARNRIKTANSTATVVVEEESNGPPIESHDNEQRAHVGAAVQLSCNVPAAYRVRWTKNGGPLPRTVLQRTDGSLYIRHAQKTDTGRYVCDLQDKYGRRTSNYINLHIDGDEECTETQFYCYDNTGCIDVDLLCDGTNDCPDESDERNCIDREKRIRSSSRSARNRHALGPSGDRQPAPLVAIEQTRREFRLGENVEVLCRARSREDRAVWSRLGTNEHVDQRRYGDGSMLIVSDLQSPDAGFYRCTGTSPSGQTAYEDFELRVQPGSGVASPDNQRNDIETYTVALRSSIDVPCKHNLEQPVSTEWRREYGALQPEVRAYDQILRLEEVKESDAGTYICRASNGRSAVESRAIVRVSGIVPSFDGNGWVSLPTLKEAYKQFDIEISFKPQDGNGLILYNSQRPNADRKYDYLALHMVDQVPEFVHDAGSGPVVVRGDRPLQLNTWHTIRISKTNSKVTMDVDNNGPVSVPTTSWELLELTEPMYIGGVPDYNQLPEQLAGTSGFIGCVSMLILGREEKNIILDSIERYNIQECDTCSANLCYRNGVCQEARNERGYVCLCAAGYAGLNCDRTGEACRPGLCGPGKCIDTADSYKCACPVTYTGRNCNVKQSIEYPAFTGSAYLAIGAPKSSRSFRMAMKVKAAAPVTDGIIMYCAESPRGYGGFTALTVHNGRLEFTYDLGDGSQPVVLTSNRTLPANEWTDVNITRVGPVVKLMINLKYSFEKKLESSKNDFQLETPMFVGGVDDSIVLNKNIDVTAGFNGCIKDVAVYGYVVDIVSDSIQSANVKECSNYDRGDIPEDTPGLLGVDMCSLCRNGGECSSDGSACLCPAGYGGTYCENRVPYRRPPGDPCAASPCRNGGSCRRDYSTRMNYTCDCSLGYAGTNCQMPLELLTSVGFNGNGYIELPASELRYDIASEPAVIALAFHTTNDGVLLYQREARAAPNDGDYLLIRVDRGVVVMDWDLGGGLSTVTIDDVYVADGERHSIIAKLYSEYYVSLTVDTTSRNGTTTGFSNIMNADSNIYVGGIPDALNVNQYPGLNGCVEQIELMNANRGINLGTVAVAGRNTQRCKNSMFPDVYPFFEEIEVFESPPPRFPFNSHPRVNSGLCLALTPSLYLVFYLY